MTIKTSWVLADRKKFLTCSMCNFTLETDSGEQNGQGWLSHCLKTDPVFENIPKFWKGMVPLAGKKVENDPCVLVVLPRKAAAGNSARSTYQRTYLPVCTYVFTTYLSRYVLTMPVCTYVCRYSTLNSYFDNFKFTSRFAASPYGEGCFFSLKKQNPRHSFIIFCESFIKVVFLLYFNKISP